MAHKKAAGSTSLGRESESKRLGVKLTDGEWAKTGAIIIRQRGTKYHPGVNVKKGKDDTLFAMKNGFVKFSTKKLRKFYNSLQASKLVSVIPPAAKTVKAPIPAIKK
ncbi:MAG: 50S ribosomal protein L27 [Patescibacteria group bacterium]